MYLAGFTAILLLWGATTALGYLAEYGLQTWGVDFLGRNPWIRGPLWGGVDGRRDGREFHHGTPGG